MSLFMGGRMQMFLSIAMPVMSMLYVFVFAAILIMVLALVAISKSFRRFHLVALLIPIGIIEVAIISYYSANSYYISHQVYLISYGTITSGITIPVLYAIRSLLNKTVARIMLFSLGLIALLLAIDWLPSFKYFYPLSNVIFVIVSATIGIYFIVTSILLSVKKQYKTTA